MSAGHIADAEGAYNAILDQDPGEYRAHLGLADCVAARGLSDWAVDHLVENARAYAEQRQMRGAFALMTKALAVAPGRLDLHIDVAEFEATDGRPEMAALRLENLARTYVAAGQEEEAELVLEAAAAFRAEPEPVVFEPEESGPAPFVNPHTGHATPAPRLVITPNVPSAKVRAAASPPPPPPTSRATGAPSTIDPTLTPVVAMVRPTPLKPQAAPPPPPKPRAKDRSTEVLSKAVAPPKAKRSSRGRSSGSAPKWRPSTVTKDPPPRPKKPAQAAKPAAVAKPEKRVSISKPPRPRKAATPVASYPKQRPSLVAAPSPKRGGKKLEKLPPLRPAGSLATRLRAASTSPRVTTVGEEDRTTLWRRAT